MRIPAAGAPLITIGGEDAMKRLAGGLAWVTGLLVLVQLGSLFAGEAAAENLISFLNEKDELAQTARPCAFDSISKARPPGEGPTKVQIGVRVLDLIEIDDISQSMTVDLVLYARWKDANLAKKRAGGQACTLPVNAVWNPGLVIVGDRQLRAELAEEVVVEPDGSVAYLQRLIGGVRATADLRAFPMDTRILKIQIVAPGYSPETVLFSPIKERTGLQPDPSVSNWVFGREMTEVSSYLVANLGAVASYTFSVEARRRSAVYVWRLAMPVVLILLMSWIPFWMPSKEIGARNSLAALAMLNMVAFQSVIRSMLPPVPYMTQADTITTGALMLIFFALLESSGTSILEFNGHTNRALLINRISRLAFPLAALAIVLMTPLI